MSSSDLAASVMEVTGCSRQAALNLLDACSNDVQAAVNLFLANEENGENDVVDVESVADIVEQYPGEDNIRAPIAPIREQLIGPDDDNFRHASQAAGVKARTLPRIKVCPLRDFAREGSIMEENLAGDDSTILHSVLNDRPTRSSRSIRAQEMARRARSSTSTSLNSSVGRLGLGDLFRPPTDLTVAGTFQYVRTKATNMKHWLLVNVQSDNFNSQLLNRDVWSQSKVRDLIKNNFLLWQVLSDTIEGARFGTFYHCNETPYICIIDPRTGEELWKCEHPNKIDFVKSLQTFLTKHASEGFFQSDLSDSTKPGPSSSIQSKTENSSTKTGLRKRSRSIGPATELTEEEQIQLAMRNSLKENGTSKKSKVDVENEEDAFQEISDSDDDFDSSSVDAKITQETYNYEKVVPELHSAYLGTSKDEITTLKIRLVSVGIDESTTIKWPSDTKLRALQLYISEHFPMVKEKFKLISPFPRKIVDLDEENLMQTLKDANLHPSSTLHVHLDD